MRLYTPESLRYPITVTKLLKQPGDEIEQDGHLFNYEYKSKVQQWDEFEREDVEVEKTFYSTFESELEGTVAALNVKAGQVLTRRTMVADVDEACKHEVQFGGLCANCGKDMAETHSYNESAAMTQRATINTVHGRTELLVSEEEATKADEEAKRRLLDSRRLSLVVDLDQTIIHASVEPTIGEWQNDLANPNHEAVKDVCKFFLEDDAPGRPGTWYYIKLRPGLRDFLKIMSQYYEMHIYTMGTRAYAGNIAKLVDPEQQIFGDRILSRDESGSMTAKNLKRLFPVDTKMVVIIDDRADVWHWIPNLVKVNVYEFFVGIGDINSSFLPKRPEMDGKPKPANVEKTPTTSDTSDASSSDSASDATTPSTAPTTPPTTNPVANGDVSAVAQMVNMAGQQDAKSIKTKEEEQEQVIAAQLEDRPLLQKQKELERLEEEEEAKASPAAEAAAELLSENGDRKENQLKEEPPRKHYRSNLLQDDDTELMYLEQNLRNIHKAYYDEYERDAAGSKGSRVAELRPGHTKKRSVDEFQHIPDAAIIMDHLKSKVLRGVHIVFSGVVPLGVDIQNHDTALWAKSFGATVSENITKRTTHVIASPERRTAKVRQAAKKGGKIAIVAQSWLLACFSQWERIDENPYRIHSDAPTNGAAGLPDSFDNGNDFMLSSSDDEAAQTEDETEDGETPNATGNGRLTLDTDFDTDTDTEELEKFAPTIARQDSSPTETEAADDWDEMNAELEEFLGSDNESGSESESEGTGMSSLKTPPSQRKRKSDERESDDETDRSRLQKRKKEALGRTSSLANLVASSQESGSSAKEAADDTDGDFDLEAALAAEFEGDEDEEAATENGGSTGSLDG